MTEKISKEQRLLVIVESPNKVHTVSSILKSLGYKKATVIASVGHTTQIKNVKESYANTGIFPEDDFRIEWEVAPEKRSVVEKLKAAAKNADLILIASDPDREGESLGNHIKNLLKVPKSKYYRIKYHSITKSDIQKALENPSKMDEDLCDAAESRQALDKMIGYALSPVAKAFVGAKSVGRCQSAGLKLICDREREIRDFVPEKFFELVLHFNKNGTAFKAKYIGKKDQPVDRIMSSDSLAEIKAMCRLYKDVFTIADIKTRVKLDSTKPPYCTATFQQDANSKLGLKVKDAMSCAQKLFEAGRITYMRTDATDLAAEFLPSLKSYIETAYGTGVYKKPKVGKKQENAQEGHEALRVTDPFFTPDSLEAEGCDKLLLKVYKLIWQRTIACAMPPAEISETTYTIACGPELFKLVSNELLKPGYRVIYSKQDLDVKDEALITETFAVGEQLKDTKLVDTLKQTSPPARYKEATLIKELQRLEIGRPSTFATIVETVLSATRGYCSLEDKVIVPTDLGMNLASFLDESFSDLISLKYTKELEEQLDLIATGKLSKLEFLRTFYACLEKSIKARKAQEGNNEASPVCPNCGGEMILRRSKYGKLFYGCAAFPKCKGIVNYK